MMNLVKHKKWQFVIAIVLALCLVCVLIRVAVNIGTERKSELESAALRLDVEPSLEGIVGYIEESIHLGMSRDRVKAILSDITPSVAFFTHDPESSGFENTDLISIYFYQSSQHPGHWLTLYAQYDNEGNLIQLHNDSTELSIGQ